MRNFLSELYMESDESQSQDETTLDIVAGDTQDAVVSDEGVEAAVENIADAEQKLDTIEVASEQLEDDIVTLEGLMDSFRTTINENRTLSRDGFVYAANHIQSLTKRYGVDFDPAITFESASADLTGEQVKLTLEAAEDAKEGLWQRFKAMVKAFFRSFIGFFKSILNFNKAKVEKVKAKTEKIKSSMKENNQQEYTTQTFEAQGGAVRSIMESNADNFKLSDIIAKYKNKLSAVDKIVTAYNKQTTKAINDLSDSTSSMDAVKFLNEILASDSNLKECSISLCNHVVMIEDEMQKQRRLYVEKVEKPNNGLVDIKITLNCLSEVEKFVNESASIISHFDKMIKEKEKLIDMYFNKNTSDSSSNSAFRLTWSELGLRAIKMIVYDVAGFSDMLSSLIDRKVKES